MQLNLADRLFKSWRTSTVGVTGTAVAVYLFTALGCRWPTGAEWTAVILPALVGILTKEKGTK